MPFVNLVEAAISTTEIGESSVGSIKPAASATGTGEPFVGRTKPAASATWPGESFVGGTKAATSAFSRAEVAMASVTGKAESFVVGGEVAV